MVENGSVGGGVRDSRISDGKRRQQGMVIEREREAEREREREVGEREREEVGR